MCQVWERGEMYTEPQWGNLQERDNFEDQDINGRKILK
jgi:hypothetical protein